MQNGQEVGPWYQISRSIPRVSLPPVTLQFINILQPSKSVLATEDKVFKSMSLRVTLHSYHNNAYVWGSEERMRKITLCASTGNTQSFESCSLPLKWFLRNAVHLLYCFSDVKSSLFLQTGTNFSKKLLLLKQGGQLLRILKLSVVRQYLISFMLEFLFILNV